MKPLGRNSSLVSILKRLPDFIYMAYNSIVIFSNPITLWKAYITGKKPKKNRYKLRNGMIILLSDNDHDSITVMVIFCRKEYGNIKSNSQVIDIGANIGIFTLYAIWLGVKSVVSVEPNNESFEVLRKNIETNKLKERVFLFNKAIAKDDGIRIFIQRTSSPYNKIEIVEKESQDLQSVDTISIETLFEEMSLTNVDLLKMDCEGAEYDVLYNLKSEIYDRISEIRMEHHNGKEKSNLLKFLSKNKYNLINDKHMILWFDKN